VLEGLSALLQSECNIGKVLFSMFKQMRSQPVGSSLQRGARS
jgi:hypothetical protein